MPYRVEVIADSISPQAVRLTTLAVTMPRIVLAELNTHRAFSRADLAISTGRCGGASVE